MSEKIWKRIATRVVNSGAFPFPVTEKLIKFMKEIMTEDEAKFLLNFRKSMNLMKK